MNMAQSTCSWCVLHCKHLQASASSVQGPQSHSNYVMCYGLLVSPHLSWQASAQKSNVTESMALQALFCERQQALLHGDLHTGSFMVTESTTFAIDAEFAFYGPMAFDVSKMIANLLVAYFASAGRDLDAAESDSFRLWLLEVPIIHSWVTFISHCFKITSRLYVLAAGYLTLLHKASRSILPMLCCYCSNADFWLS